MENNLLVDQIRSTLGDMIGISLAYLFGSQVAGTAGTMSDVDLGILLENTSDAGQAYSVLTHQLNKGLGSAQVDVVLLHQAPVELAYAIIAQGVYIYQKDTFTRVEYEADVLSSYGDYLPVLRAQREDILGGGSYDRRVQRYREAFRRTERTLSDSWTRLEPLKNKPLHEFEDNPYLRDIVERNLEVAAQACIDISHRIISLEDARKPIDYYDAFLIMGEIGVIPPEFARQIAPIAGFRNILVHEYLRLDWDLVYQNLQRLDDLNSFREHVVGWLKNKLNA